MYSTDYSLLQNIMPVAILHPQRMSNQSLHILGLQRLRYVFIIAITFFMSSWTRGGREAKPCARNTRLAAYQYRFNHN